VGFSQAIEVDVRDSLRGLSLLKLMVREPDPFLRGAGVEAAGLEADLLARLEEAGIGAAAFDRTEPLQADQALLVLDMETAPHRGSDHRACIIRLRIYQAVVLPRGPAQIWADTWARDAFAVLGPAELASVRSKAGRLVDLLIRDFWTANTSGRA